MTFKIHLLISLKNLCKGLCSSTVYPQAPTPSNVQIELPEEIQEPEGKHTGTGQRTREKGAGPHSLPFLRLPPCAQEWKCKDITTTTIIITLPSSVPNLTTLSEDQPLSNKWTLNSSKNGLKKKKKSSKNCYYPLLHWHILQSAFHSGRVKSLSRCGSCNQETEAGRSEFEASHSKFQVSHGYRVACMYQSKEKRLKCHVQEIL